MISVDSKEWSGFLSEIFQAKKSLNDPDILWYRGHWNENHYLLPTLLRYKNGLDKEIDLFTNFQKFGDKIHKRRDSEWETLFEMQHYGIPTRLLDWTESFGISLFFAAFYNNYHSEENVNAAIYLLDPFKLNNISKIKKVYKLPADEDTFKYTEKYLDPAFRPKAPLAIDPIFSNERMSAQRGVFTVHDDSIEPIETKYPNAIKKVILPKEIISAAVQFLDLANINHYTVFPDFFGLARYLDETSGLIPRWK